MCSGLVQQFHTFSTGAWIVASIVMTFLDALSMVISFLFGENERYKLSGSLACDRGRARLIAVLIRQIVLNGHYLRKTAFLNLALEELGARLMLTKGRAGGFFYDVINLIANRSGRPVLMQLRMLFQLYM